MNNSTSAIGIFSCSGSLQGIAAIGCASAAAAAVPGASITPSASTRCAAQRALAMLVSARKSSSPSQSPTRSRLARLATRGAGTRGNVTPHDDAAGLSSSLAHPHLSCSRHHDCAGTGDHRYQRRKLLAFTHRVPTEVCMIPRLFCLSTVVAEEPLFYTLVGRAATGTRGLLRARSPLPVQQHGRP